MTTREVEEASSQDEELVEVRKSINRSSSTNSTFNAVMSYALVLVLLVVIGIKGNTNCYTKEIKIQSSEFGTRRSSWRRWNKTKASQ